MSFDFEKAINDLEVELRARNSTPAFMCFEEALRRAYEAGKAEADKKWDEMTDRIHADTHDAGFRRGVEKERERCLDWVAAESRDCGCSERIAAAIREGK